jgi:O-antigen ligase
MGAVEEWATFALEAASVALMLLWAGKQLTAKRITLADCPLYLPCLLFFGVILAQIALHTSAYPYATKYDALKYVCFGIILLVAVECLGSGAARKRFALTMTSFGALYALFALIQGLASNGKIFWIYASQSGGAIYGSYINRDHYAGLMEMLAPIPLVLGLSKLLNGGQRVLLAFCGALMATTIFLSGSRGGMFSFAGEMIILAALSLRKTRSPRTILACISVCVATVILVAYVGGGQVLGRLGDLSPGVRLNMTQDTIRMALKRPILGWGLGTFSTVYPAYRGFYTNLFVNAAHNDYAQLFAETGILGFACIVLFLTRMFRAGVANLRNWETSWTESISFAALIGCTGIFFHSFVDFNLQIPANAACFFILCGLVGSVSSNQREAQSSPNSIDRSREALH